jgi:hypothetical protein
MDSSGSLLRFSHLNYQIKTNLKGSAAKVLIDDISVVIKAGELLAIMVRFIISAFSVSHVIISGIL